MILGILALILGLTLFLWPHRRAKAVEARIAAGDDTYLEEQRTYRAYPRLRDPRYIRVAGAVVALLGLAMLALDYFRG